MSNPLSREAREDERWLWEIIHADGTVCDTVEGEEGFADAVVHFWDSNAGTGAPMSCSPHTVRRANPSTGEGTE